MVGRSAAAAALACGGILVASWERLLLLLLPDDDLFFALGGCTIQKTFQDLELAGVRGPACFFGGN